MAFTSKDVMDLRQKTGVGMMDCKAALQEADGDMEKAAVILREKGMATAAKRAGKIAAEGMVDSYIHMGGKIGVLVEVNCETDFVAGSDSFKSLVHDIALHIAACNPQYLSKEDVPQEKIDAEKEILRAQAMNEPKPKPEAVIEKMIEGRINKYFEEVCLLEQKFVKDPNKTITQLVNDAIGTMGEKISIRRFVRFERGEGIEKKKADFADEVNEQINKIKNN